MNPSDAEKVFALRRRAVSEEPLAFLASPEDDAASSIDVVQRMLGNSPDTVVFGAVADELVGMLGFYREGRAKIAHKVQLWGMYVTPEYRGDDVGSRLLQTALSHARQLGGVATVNLTVAETAAAARRIYEKEGFTVWGLEPDAMRHNSDIVAEYHLQLVL